MRFPVLPSPVYILLLIILGNLPLQDFAQGDLLFQQISVKDRLPHNSVFAIMEDPYGFVWFGTRGGLVRNEGHGFKFYYAGNHHLKHPNGNDITRLVYDSKGKIWMVCESRGISMLDPVSDTFTHYDTSALARVRIAHNKVRNLAFDHLGRMWIATEEGVQVLIPEEDRIFTISMQGEDSSRINLKQVSTLLEDRDGYMWIGTWETKKGLFRLRQKVKDIREGTPLTANILKTGEIGSYRSSSISKIMEDTEGNIWASTQDGLLLYDKGNDSLIIFNHVSRGNSNHFLTMAATPQGEILLGGKGTGLVRFNPESKEFTRYMANSEVPNTLSGNDIRSILVDKSGILWVGTHKRGINFSPAYRTAIQFYRDHGFSGKATEELESFLYEDPEGILWIMRGNRYLKDVRGGLSYFDDKTRTQIPVPLSPEIAGGWNITGMQHDHQGHIWIITQHGLGEFDPANFSIRLLKENPGTPFRLYAGDTNFTGIFSNGDQFAFGSRWGGLYTFDPASLKGCQYRPEEKDAHNLDTYWISHLYRDKRGQVWVASGENGLLRFDMEADVFTPVPVINQLTQSIQRITEGPDGQLWLATTNLGLVIFDPETEKVRVLNRNYGLANEQVSSIIFGENGNIWVGTGAGLSSFNPLDSIFVNYNFRQQHSFDPWIDGFKRKNGEIAFTRAGMLILLDSKKLHDEPYVPPVYLTEFSSPGFSLHNPYFSHQEKIRLDYDQNDFSISYASLDYVDPGAVKYQIKLEGYHQDWVMVGHKSDAHFTNLSPGNYTFYLKATNSLGNWSPRVVSTRIEIIPPWYNTWWAFMLFMVFTLVVIYLLHRFQLRRRMQIEETRRLRELDEYKNRFFTNITHEFQTPLTVIIGLTRNILQSVNGHLSSTMREHLDRINWNAERLRVMVNQMLGLAKLEHGTMEVDLIHTDIISYLRYVSGSFESLAMEKKINLSFNSSSPELEMDYDQEKIRMILSNLIHNAIKFTPEGGKVETLAELVNRGEESLLQITVSDNGIGIPDADQKNIFDRFFQVENNLALKKEGTGLGLSLTRELVRLLEGEISLTSSDGKGSSFRILLQVRHQFKDTARQEKEKDNIPPDTEAILLPSNSGNGHSEDKPTILIIEDNPDIIYTLIAHLGDSYRIISEQNGDSGLARAREVVPDMVITDIMMPGIDGYEVCRRLKSDYLTSHLPVIMLTARSADQARIEGHESGADEFLTKPFSEKELSVILRKQYGLRQKLQARYSNGEIQPNGFSPTPDDEFISTFRKMVHDHIDKSEYGVPDWCREMGMSKTQLSRKIKAVTGRSLTNYISFLRLLEAKRLLKTSSYQINDIASMTGIDNPSYFSRLYKEEFGQSPSETREE